MIIKPIAMVIFSWFAATVTITAANPLTEEINSKPPIIVSSTAIFQAVLPEKKMQMTDLPVKDVVAELFSAVGLSPTPLTSNDWDRQQLLTILYAIDHAQTMGIYHNPQLYRELNPVIRQHWSPNGIRNYFIVASAFELFLTRATPVDWRPALQWVNIGMQSIVVLHNQKAGLAATRRHQIELNFKF